MLDTNIVSDLRRPRPNPGLVTWIGSVDELKLFLSVVTIGELHTGIVMQRDTKRRADLETWLVSDLIPRFEGVFSILTSPSLSAGDASKGEHASAQGSFRL